MLWAEAGVPLAGELMSGAADPRSNCVELLDRSIAALPAGVGKIRARWDAGYFAAALARACIQRGIEFAIGVKRNAAVIRAAQAGGLRWVPAVGMDDTELAVIDYLPGAWPPSVVCLARRTRIPVQKIPTERARKRRTIPKDQLALALEGRIEAVFGYSFILTNLDVSDDEALAEVEWWYRHRTDIEALNKDGNSVPRCATCPTLSSGVGPLSGLTCVFVLWTVSSTRPCRRCCQRGPMGSAPCCPGVSRRGALPVVWAVRAEPRASARACRSWRLSSSRWRIRWDVASSLRSRDASVARCRWGVSGAAGDGCRRVRRAWISARMSC